MRAWDTSPRAPWVGLPFWAVARWEAPRLAILVVIHEPTGVLAFLKRTASRRAVMSAMLFSKPDCKVTFVLSRTPTDPLAPLIQWQSLLLHNIESHGWTVLRFTQTSKVQRMALKLKLPCIAFTFETSCSHNSPLNLSRTLLGCGTLFRSSCSNFCNALTMLAFDGRVPLSRMQSPSFLRSPAHIPLLSAGYQGLPSQCMPDQVQIERCNPLVITSHYPNNEGNLRHCARRKAHIRKARCICNRS